MSRLELVPVGDVGEHPRNVRRGVGDLSELTASIRSVGVLEPLVVAPDTTMRPVQWVLIAGHRRLRAAKKAGLAEVPALVRDDLDDLAGQVSAMLVENLHRADLSPVEEADAYQLLLDDAGLKVKDVAKRTGRSQDTVRSRLRLRGLPEPARNQLHAGQMSMTDALALADLADLDPDAPARALEAATGPDDLRWAIHRVRRDTERTQAPERHVVDAADTVSEGTGGVTRPPGPVPGHPGEHTAAGAAASDSAEDELAWQRWQAWKADRDTAAGIRRSWLHDLLAEGGIHWPPRTARVPWEDTVHLALTLPLITDITAEGGDLDAWLRGLPRFPGPLTDTDPYYSRTRSALAGVTPPTAALCVLMAGVETIPQHYTTGDAFVWVAYWQALTAAGYELTAWEVDELDRCQRALLAAGHPEDEDPAGSDSGESEVAVEIEIEIPAGVEDVVDDLDHDERDKAGA